MFREFIKPSQLTKEIMQEMELIGETPEDFIERQRKHNYLAYDEDGNEMICVLEVKGLPVFKEYQSKLEKLLSN